MTALFYVIIPISEVEQHLSSAGTDLLGSARKSVDGTLLIRSLNHPEERISLMFKDGFDYTSFLSNYEVLTKEQALAVMNTIEWDLSEDE